MTVSKTTSIFDYADYKDFLRAVVTESTQRGIVKLLADSAQVHRPYLSRVLNDKVHLQPEQLYGVSRYLQLSDSETEYLLLLLEKHRSSKSDFIKYVDSRIDILKKGHVEKTKTEGRTDASMALDVDSFTYYSHWIYPLVHVAVSIPSFQRIEVLSRKLGESLDRILQVLGHLERMGFVVKERDLWKWKKGSWHTSITDPRTTLNHRNLHDLSQRQFYLDPELGTHFSVIQSISENDFEKLRRSLLNWLSSFNKIAGPSKPEVAIGLCFDFFRIGK